MIGKVVGSVIGVVILLGTVGYVGGIFSEGAQVVQQEFGPKASLVKYEWFKDASNALEAKANDIALYENVLKNMDSQYEGVAKKD